MKSFLFLLVSFGLSHLSLSTAGVLPRNESSFTSAPNPSRPSIRMSTAGSARLMSTSQDTRTYSWMRDVPENYTSNAAAKSDNETARVARSSAPKAGNVFAHLMVGNVPHWSVDRWKTEMNLAYNIGIDAFALNFAYKDDRNVPTLQKALDATAGLSFRVFFSFDYAGGGDWPMQDVIDLIKPASSYGGYFTYQGKPFVSTFEGPGRSDDWITIKAQTNCYFVPDWSSLGARVAVGLSGGVADGLFSWAAWSWGNTGIDTYTDASYMDELTPRGKTYMMAASPWFYTNMPGYDKNWLWKGDANWHSRWRHAQFINPDFVQIISWNDYGESHYIGPLDDLQYEAFDSKHGRAPFNYVKNMPHDGWRAQLSYYIYLYRVGSLGKHLGIADDSIVVWYRLSPSRACFNGYTTGNTASQLQVEFQPWDVVGDRIYFTALLAAPATLVVSIGATVVPASFSFSPAGGAGMYLGAVDFQGLQGVVTIKVQRDGVELGRFIGKAIQNTCSDVVGGTAYTNWNAWVGSQKLIGISAIATTASACVAGTGANEFATLCAWTCARNYCPPSACHCTSLGFPPTLPASKNVRGYPAAGRSASFSGLCDFACNYGNCLTAYCSLTVQPLSIPTVSPFLPKACISGVTKAAQYTGLCSYSCNFGYCPINFCTCSAQGVLTQPPGKDGSRYPNSLEADGGLCKFTCERGYCPKGVCAQTRWPREMSFAAYGDSYAAGIGAGQSVSKDEWDPDNSCRKYNHAYSYKLINIGDGMYNKHQLAVSCTGAVIDNIGGVGGPDGKRDSQIALARPKMHTVGWATLSIGGNDADFGDIAYTCLVTPADGKCEEKLEAAEEKLSDPLFAARLRNVYLLILDVHPNPDFLLVVTGYAKFFNVDDEKPCSDNYFGYGHYLDIEHRKKLNSLVDHMNRIIKDAVFNANQADATDKRVVFHDWDAIYAENSRRFCEPGEDWKTYAWFLTINGDDEELSGSVIPSSTYPPVGQSLVNLVTQAPICLAKPPTDKAGQRICLLAQATVSRTRPLNPDVGLTVYPDYAMKFMHPKSAAHQALANSIYKSMGYN